MINIAGFLKNFILDFDFLRVDQYSEHYFFNNEELGGDGVLRQAPVIGQKEGFSHS